MEESAVQLTQVVAVSYNINAGLALDADLALRKKRGAYRMLNMKFLRLAFVLKREAT